MKYWLVPSIIVVGMSFLVNSFLLQSFFGYGLVAIDLNYLIPFKRIDGDFLQKVLGIWVSMGPRGGYYSLYLGIVDRLIPFNYETLLNLNFLWKVLATASLYPSIMIITKDKLLAYLCTFFFAISYSSVGFLTFASTGVEYLGIIFINFFVIAYYFFIRSKRLILFLLSFLLLYLALFVSFLRIFPILFVLGLVIFILLLNKKLSIKQSVFQLIIYALPAALMLSITTPIDAATRANIFENTIQPILSGNLYILSTPLAGLGFQFVSPWYKYVFGTWDLVTFLSYLKYLIPWLIIGILITSFIAKFTVKNYEKFLLLFFSIQIAFLLILYIVFTFDSSLPPNLVIPHDKGSWESAFFASLAGSFMISMSLSYGWIWSRQKNKNFYFLLIFIAPLFSFLFIGFTWFLEAKHFNFDDGIHRYLPLSSVGISIFFGALITAIIKDRIGKLTQKFPKILFILILISYLFTTSYKEINTYFKKYRSLGRELSEQIKLQNEFYSRYVGNKDFLLIYFDKSNSQKDSYWQEVLSPDFFDSWAALRKYYFLGPSRKQYWCFADTASNFDELKSTAILEKQNLNFKAQARCGKDAMKNPETPISDIQYWIFDESDFFAFDISEGKIIDRTSIIKERLRSTLQK